MYTKKKIEIPIYFGELVIIQTDKPEDLPKKYELEGIQAYDAVVFPMPRKDGRTRYFAIFREDCRPKTIAHEVVHIVNCIFRDRDMKLDVNNDEAQAYLTGWVTEQCYNNLKVKL